MLKLSLAISALFFSVGTFVATPESRSDKSQTPPQWLEERYKEATSIKIGMSRADLKRVFEEDGGLQRLPASRYVLRNCRMIKVDVEFDEEYGQAYKARPDEELRIKSISRPYLEPAYVD